MEITDQVWKVQGKSLTKSTALSPLAAPLCFWVCSCSRLKMAKRSRRLRGSRAGDCRFERQVQ